MFIKTITTKMKRTLFSTLSMKRYLITFALALSVITSISGLAYALPAFPGAEGFGSTTIGGRGGKVIHVTNGNNSGPGSYREAVTASGPRIVVFDIGGYINLTSELKVVNPYLTIAGQTAPGGGITIRGGRTMISTHDVIIRGVRFRSGSGAPDNFNIFSNDDSNHQDVYNVIVDHCSFSWAVDENIATWYDTHDITYQRNIISEGLYSSSGEANGKGALFGSWEAPGNAPSNISVHHNLFANNKDRSIRVVGPVEVEMINNLVYGWDWYATRTGGPMNIIGNHYIKSPVSKNNEVVRISGAPDNSVYVSHNIGPGRPTDTGDEWNIANSSESAAQANSPTFPLSNVVIDDVEDVYDDILGNVGVTVPMRDAVDVRILNEVATRTGTWAVEHEDDVGGYPTLSRGTPPLDTDQDGMPNQWELTVGLNPNDGNDANKDRDGDGYTNIEEFINGLYPMSGINTVSPPKNLRISTQN